MSKSYSEAGLCQRFGDVLNTYEDIFGKKDGNLKTLMLGLQIHISLTASNATRISSWNIWKTCTLKLRSLVKLIFRTKKLLLDFKN